MSFIIFVRFLFLCFPLDKLWFICYHKYEKYEITYF